MVRAPCVLNSTFPLIYWLFINQIRHGTYQIEADFHSYSMVPCSYMIADKEKF